MLPIDLIACNACSSMCKLCMAVLTCVSRKTGGVCQAARETAAGQTQVCTKTMDLEPECRVGEAVLVHLRAAVHALIKVSLPKATCKDRWGAGS